MSDTAKAFEELALVALHAGKLGAACAALQKAAEERARDIRSRAMAVADTLPDGDPARCMPRTPA